LERPFSEPTLFKIGAALKATHHRHPPADFGPLASELLSKPFTPTLQLSKSSMFEAIFITAALFFLRAPSDGPRF